LAKYWETKDISDFDKSMNYFEKLRKFAGENDYVDSSQFMPAIGLYSRGETEDKAKAVELLTDLEKIRPMGPLHSNSIFWLGRLAEEAGDAKLAESYFRQLVRETPYGYYGIRAQMHLDLGELAKYEISPSKDTVQRIEHANDVDNKKEVAESARNRSPYEVRLDAFLNSGIYALTVDAFNRTRRDFPAERMESIPLEELDKRNMLGQVALLMAIRQDAFAAIDNVPEAKDRISIATKIGEKAKDWPTSVTLVGALDKPFEINEANQNERGYKEAAFPIVYEELFNECSARYGLPQGLLYGIVKAESAFSSVALSTSGALGLFQFTPPRFNSLNNKYKLLQNSGKRTREEFLLDPQLSMDLEARCLKEELLPRYENNIVFALMDHIAGPAVIKWRARWENINKIGDYEFVIDSARFLGVGPFVRAVLATFWIKGLGRTV
jgi:soluble lytic murein transglycosylase-like protein